ncbi:MAG: RecX family transcriptional regulator [Prevotellaceae bacterium]|jgi:regulatory protein|nr:RecX family transcriptional regulator [Prevotellaceae bacterium]
MKQITPEEALIRLQALCSSYEKCTCDIRQKLIEYKIEPAKIAEIIQKLQNAGFVDDLRFACSFARTKHDVSKWGKQKIEYHLRAKQIPEEFIKNALENISDEAYGETVVAELAKKLKTTKAKSQSELIAKLMKFALSRGYDYSVSYEAIKNMIYDGKNN